jgi:putative endonuclease
MPATLNHPYAVPAATSGYLIVAALGSDRRALLHYGSPDGGLFGDHAAAERWADANISSNSPWAVVPVAGPSSEDPVAVAAKWLTDQGFRVLDKRWKCLEGELAVVATDRQTFVAVDITNSLVAPLSPKRCALLRQLAVRWVVTHGVLFEGIRVDQVAVQQDGSRGLAVTRHQQDVG